MFNVTKYYLFFCLLLLVKQLPLKLNVTTISITIGLVNLDKFLWSSNTVNHVRKINLKSNIKKYDVRQVIMEVKAN